MNNKRICSGICLVFVLLTVILSVASCTSAEKTYKTDVSVEVLSKNAESVIRLENSGDRALTFKKIGDLAVSTLTGIGDLLDDPDCMDYTFRNTGGYSADEYGIIRFKTAEAAQNAKTAVRKYLDSKAADTTQRSYYSDSGKFDESEIRVYGVYLVYSILTKSNRTALFSELDTLLDNSD